MKSRAFFQKKKSAAFLCPYGIEYCEGGKGMRRCGWHGRQCLGCVLALGGVMLVFVCLPVQLFLIALGVGMTAAGIVLLDF